MCGFLNILIKFISGTLRLFFSNLYSSRLKEWDLILKTIPRLCTVFSKYFIISDIWWWPWMDGTFCLLCVKKNYKFEMLLIFIYTVTLYTSVTTGCLKWSFKSKVDFTWRFNKNTVLHMPCVAFICPASKYIRPNHSIGGGE
jgi:hypothetical protein